MKTILKRTLILAALSLAITSNGYSQSQPAVQTSDTRLFPGHGKTNENANKQSTDIVVAVFTALGGASADADDESSFDQAVIEIVNSLKGTLSGKLQVFYDVQTFPLKDQESAPILGTQYIMFIKELGPKEHRIIKLLPATDANIAKVKALISAAPASK